MADLAQLNLVAGMAQGAGKVAQGYSTQMLSKAEADATERAAAVEAAGLRARAAEERTAAQGEARNYDRRTKQVMGKQVALAAASGGGATDPTILDLIGETAAHGEEQRLAAMAKGESAARGLEDKAAYGSWQAGTRATSTRAKGDAALTGSIFEGLGKASESMYKYGERSGWWDDGSSPRKPATDDTDLKTGWRTRVYKAR